MKPTRALKTKLIAICLGLAATLAVSIGFYYGLYETLGLERLTVDFRFRHFNHEIADSNQLGIVAIDDNSLTDFGQWPWPRTYLAQIINLLGEMNSKEILVDLVFSTPKKENTDDPDVFFGGLGEDEALAAACKKQDKTILACYFSPGSKPSPLYNILLRDFSLGVDELVRKTGLPVAQVQAELPQVRKQVAGELVSRILQRRPRLDKYSVMKKILGDDWLAMNNERELIEQAYDYYLAYAYVQYKAATSGWMIETNTLPPSIEQLAPDTQLHLPIARLAEACADFGFVNFQPDSDGKIREVSLLKCYNKTIFRQLALAGVCESWKVNPANFKIYPYRLEIPDGSDTASAETQTSNLLSTEKNKGLIIPLNRNGKLIINWYAPHPNQWSKSFRNIVSAGGLLKIVQNQEALRKNEELLQNAIPIAIKNLLPNEMERYQKLTKQLAMLNESLATLPAEQENIDSITVKSLPTSRPSTTAPATTIEEDLQQKREEIQDQLEIIVTNTKEQLEWLYQQQDVLSPAEEIAPENRLIRDLRRCIHNPEEVQQANDDLRKTIDNQIAEVKPLISDRIILIGYTGSTTADFVPTPVFNRCPGVMVHATILNQLLQKAFLSESDRNTDLLIILVLGTLLSIITAQRSAVEGLIWMLVFLIGFNLFSGYFAFQKLHIITSMVGPSLAILLSWLFVSFYRQLTEGRARKVFAGRLGQYTSPSLVQRIIDDPRRMVICPEATEVSCYFSDLEGFTTLSEKLGPNETVRFLNIYFEHMSKILDAHEAFINKFQGDGIFAFFNPPLNPQKDHARRACLAAIDSQQELNLISKELRRAGIELEMPLHMRIGIGTGPAVVGDCGSERKFDYTCLGDTVNFASRLETVNKCFGTRILISENTFENMGPDLLARLLGRIRLAGRRQPIVVYELIGYREDYEDHIDFVERFDHMVRLYWQNKLTELPALLDQLESLHAGDKAVAIYRTLLNRIRSEGSHLWQDGVIDCDTKS